jgi:hypothetical protein
MRESQWPKGPTVITAHQHGANDSGGSRQRGSAKRKTPKGGTKGAFETGRTQRLGRTCENLPQRRRCRKRHRWTVSETQPESEEARPVAEANEQSKAVADLMLSGQDAELNRRRVLTWFAGRWRNHQSKRAEKPHSKFSIARYWTALLRAALNFLMYLTPRATFKTQPFED